MRGTCIKIIMHDLFRRRNILPTQKYVTLHLFKPSVLTWSISETRSLRHFLVLCFIFACLFSEPVQFVP